MREGNGMKCPDCDGWGGDFYDDKFGMNQFSECKTCNGTEEVPDEYRLRQRLPRREM